MTAGPKPSIAVAGAGSIGCYVGGLLHLAGFDVSFLARPRMAQAVTQSGLRLTDYAGLDETLHLSMDTEAHALANARVILVCVKSGATAEMAGIIAQHARADALVLSLQNGTGNAEILRHHLPGHDVRACMVPFNVVPRGGAHFHKSTSGDILVEQGVRPDLDTDHLAWESVENIEAIQWGKLLINLGNALNALSDLPLLTQLQDRAWRRLIADQQSEALAVLKAAGITPAKTTAAPPRLIPRILRLPTPLFRRIAAQMLTIDPMARSSMWDDLTQRRMTEIDAFQGAIIALGKAHNRPTPLAERIRDLVREAEAAKQGPPGLAVKDVRS